MDLVFIARTMEDVLVVVVKFIRDWNELRCYSGFVSGFVILSGFLLLLFCSVIYCLFRLRFCLVLYLLHIDICFH